VSANYGRRPHTASEEDDVILIAYDGSHDAQTAIERAGELFQGQTATVLSVWERFVDVVTRVGAGMPVGDVDYEALDRGYRDQAERLAEEGAERARQAGLDAQPRIRARERTIAATILAEADDVHAAAIVLGTRGLTGAKAFLLGSVSHAVVQHADLPVMVIPSAETAAARAGQRP
jgi:nucleotide-binding universal stress UspA family protein